jgi:hypothetical protein
MVVKPRKATGYPSGFTWQRLLVPLFTFVWWKRLHNEHPFHPGYFYRDEVVKVKGWRTAILDGFGGQRTTSTFIFKWEREAKY